MWDNRADSETFWTVQTILVGQENPAAVLIPKGVVHAYQNVGEVDGIVVNCPNRLYMGDGKKEAVDEIRHEDDSETRFVMSN
jgi:dTDP-4-dehydrorhamnose 3,5-epimerase and related enzymes